MIKYAKKYTKAGLSVVPLKQDKRPIGKWKAMQSEIITNLEDLNFTEGVGIVCGAVSGNLEVLDIDCKYDISGTLFADYFSDVTAQDPALWLKLVVQATQNHGYHLLYRCDEIEGNQKLASRPTTEEEREKHPDEKVKVLIETRGEGGYIASYPMTGYKYTSGNPTQIQTITPEERQLLFATAKSFNQIEEEKIERPKTKKVKSEGKSPWKQFDEEGDLLSVLEGHGWTVASQRGSKYLMKRPGDTDSKYGADWDEQLRVFYVWTSSTQFEPEKGYSASAVYAILEHNGDFSAAASALRGMGMGDEQPKTTGLPVNDFEEEIEDEDIFEGNDKMESYLASVRDGTFVLGRTTGIEPLDEYLRHKVGNYNIVNGHDNVGKTTVLCYLFLLDAKHNGTNSCLYLGENKNAGMKRKLIEFYAGEPLADMSADVYAKSKKFIEEHFCFLSNEDIFSAMQLLAITERALEIRPFDNMLLDPYNALRLDARGGNTHDYHYEVSSEMRHFAKRTQVSLWVNMHSVTEAARRTDKEGFPVAPNKADTEGGGKFSNRADDFVTIHRIVQHPTLWMDTEIHVRKVKENETGGRPSPFSRPVVLKMMIGSCNFETVDGINPMFPERRAANKEAVQTVVDYTRSTKIDDEDDIPA